MTATTHPAATIADDLDVPQAPMTFEEFLAWAPESRLVEWIDGEVIMMAPARREHQETAGFLYSLLHEFVETHDLGVVLPAPFLMRLVSRPSGREPDILFVKTEHLDRLRETYLDGPADLVIEVISPESVGRDRGEKFQEYETAEVPEYWLIDTLRRESLFYQLGPDGHYRRVDADADGVYRSAALSGFSLRVAWLWERPRLAEARRHLGL